jgi:uracil-DNA glycosylase
LTETTDATAGSAFTAAEPGHDCPLCPRLVALRHTMRSREPTWHNAPVATFGPSTARLLIVGLAPGLRGANRTGRPFTGDYAGDLLYPTLIDFGFATGRFAARVDDGLTMVDAAITNAVRCVPPENKPSGEEIATCRQFLIRTIAAMPNLRAILALGRISHESSLAALGVRRSAFAFGHNARHAVSPGLTLFDSYHPSRYNLNTGRITSEMFRAVLTSIREHLPAPVA